VLLAVPPPGDLGAPTSGRITKRPMEVVRVRITDAGRLAVAG